MIAKPRKKKISIIIPIVVIILSFASPLAVPLANAAKAIDSMDDDPNNWTVEQTDLANLIESTYDTVINNDLSDPELESLAGDIQSAVEAV